MLAQRTNPAAAAAHFTASGVFAATAAMAGVASAALSVEPGGAGGAVPDTGAGSGGGGGGTSERPVNQTIILIGALDTQGAEDLHDQLEEARETRDLGSTQ